MAIPVNPDFQRCFNPDLGPYKPLPLYNLENLPNVYRTLASQSQYYLGIENNNYPQGSRFKESIPLTTPTEPDPSTTWHTICGYLLYEIDGFGTRTFSGYNLVWQYQCDTVQTDWIRYILRLIKISATQPLDVTVLATEIVSLGGAGGIYTVKPYLIAFPIEHDSKIYKAIGVGGVYNKNTVYNNYVSYGTLAVSDKWFTDNGYDDTIVEIEDPNEQDPDGPSKPGGGDGDHRKIYTPVPVPGLPTIGPNSAGFIYMLRLSASQMQDFASDMLNPSLWQAIKNFFADPMDFICGIMIVPYQPTSSINVKPKFGENVFSHAYPLVSQQYTEIDCGTLDITKYYGSCFDYNPYTQLIVWLPYIGYRNLDPDEVMGTTIGIKYHCDCMTGDCVCFISAAKDGVSRVIAQYSGNCGVRVPFGSNSFDSTVSASVQLLGGAVGAIAGGALAGPAGIAAGEITASQISNSVASTTVSSVNAVKSKSERSGVAGACAGYLSIQTPYLLRILPRQSLPEKYQDLEGYPSNISGNVGEFSGFLAVETIKLKVAATSTEKDMIMQLLKGGIYV